MAEILKGAPVAQNLSLNLIKRVEILKSKNITPALEILRLGERPDDLSYESGIIKRCGKVGIEVKKIILDASCPREELLNAIKLANQDNKIHGVIMFRPLGNKELEQAARDLLKPEKDVDGMTDGSLAGVFSNRDVGFAPCTAQACIELLDFYNIDLTGKNIAVLGRSLVIGRPVSILLQNKNATVTMCHSKTKNLAEICRQSDIIIAAMGRANFVDKNFINKDLSQVIIDVGININEEGKLCGDVNFAEIESLVKAITPVPGGVGAVTTSVLAEHVIKSAEKYL